MMIEKFMNLVKACGNDVVLSVDGGNYDLTFCDFGGFDDDWNEQEREYEHPSEVAELVEWMDENCTEMIGDYYIVYRFDGFEVYIGYSSMDI